MNTKCKWVAQMLGDPNTRNWEISVVKESNTHGRKSWGWFDENKLFISGCVGEGPIAAGLGPLMIEIAHRYAAFLNNGIALSEINKRLEFKTEEEK